MTVSVGDVVAQLRALMDRIDQTVVAATRAQAGAQQARALFEEAAKGSDHPKIRRSVTESQAAGEKTAKVARLIAEANNHFAAYLNLIAPGAAPSSAPAPDSMPSGEQLIEEAEEANLLDGWLRRISGKADDLQDAAQATTKSVGDGQKAISHYLKRTVDPHSGGQTTTASTPPQSPPPATQTQQTSAPEAASALAVSTLAVAVAGKAIARYWRKTRKETPGDDDTE